MVTLESEKYRPGEKIAVLCIDCGEEHSFTPKEWKLVTLVGQNLTDKEIASRLSISVKSAKKYIATVFRKLGCIDKGAIFSEGYKRACFILWWQQHLSAGAGLSSLLRGRKRRMVVHCKNCNSPHSFTPGQWKVVSMIYQGLNNSQIAEKLGITCKSVKNRVNIIYKEVSCALKLAIPNSRRQNLISWAQKHADTVSIISNNIALYCKECDEAHTLTPREWEVLRLVIQGLSSSQIAAKIFFAPQSVRNILNSIYRKFSCVRTHGACNARKKRMGLVLWYTKHIDPTFGHPHPRKNLSRSDITVLCDCGIFHHFTPRQWEIGSLVCQGMDNQKIANTLEYKNTVGVENILYRIYVEISCLDAREKRTSLIIWWTKYIGTTEDDALKPPRLLYGKVISIRCKKCKQIHHFPAHEWEAGKLLYKGLGYKQIARVLDIRTGSVGIYCCGLSKSINCLQKQEGETHRAAAMRWWKIHANELA